MRPQPAFATLLDEHDGVSVLVLRGELDMAAVPTLREGLTHLEGSGAVAIVLDLREVTFIDSTGIHEFVEARTRANGNGHRLSVTGANQATWRLCEFTGTQFLLDQQAVPG